MKFLRDIGQFVLVLFQRKNMLKEQYLKLTTTFYLIT